MPKTVQHKQRAQIIAAVPIVILAFVGMVATVVNVGLFKMIQSEMQNAADAASLAAVWYDPVCPIRPPEPRCAADNAAMVALAARNNVRYAAYQVATDYATTYNGSLTAFLCGSQPIVRPQTTALNVPRVNALTVVITCRVSAFSGGALGLGPIDIWATGTAAIGSEALPTGSRVVVAPTPGVGRFVARLVP